MKQISNFLFFLFVIFSMNSCFFDKSEWKKTDNGFKYFSDYDTTNHYLWEGKHIDSIINGGGTWIVLDEQGNEKERKNTIARYGAIEDKFVKEISRGDIYIGKRSGSSMEGFGCYAKNNGELYIGTFNKSKPDGELTLYKNGKIYFKGGWKQGNFDGSGVLYKEGELPVNGIWDNGKLTKGNVKILLPNGEYIGNVEDKKPNGYGTFRYKGGAVYQGEWKDGKKEGEGTFISNKDTIIGSWKEGALLGKVLYKTKDFIYDGIWKEKGPEGLGMLIFSDTCYYNGSWNEGKKDGYGDYIISSKSSYSGEWINDSITGHGTLIYEPGVIYIGEWKQGLQNGYGKYSSPTFTYEGNWIEGQFQGEGKVTYQNGDTYEGDFENNKKSGVGTYFFNNGNIYEGYFSEDIINGIGKFHFKSGSVYEGEFVDGKVQGQGTLFLVLGKEKVSITGVWDGKGNFPASGSIAFENGDVYEGPLNKGFPTKEGIWSTQAGREEGKNWISKTNDFYKTHEEQWDNIVEKTQIVLTAVEVGSAIITPIFPPVLIVATMASGLSTTIAAADGLAKISSTAVDVYEGDADTALLKKRGIQLLQNDLIPMGIAKGSRYIIKTIPANKIVKISKSVTKIPIRNLMGKALPDFSKIKKPFGKVVTIVENRKGKLVSKVEKSDAGLISRRIKTRLKHQSVSNKVYNKKISSNPGIQKKLDLSKEEGNGSTLYKNMLAFLNKKKIKKEILYNGRRPDAHHIVAGNKNNKFANKARSILKKYNINVNDPRNGILLPSSGKHGRSAFKGSVHGNHRLDYDRRILEHLEKCKSQEQVLEVMDKIKRELYQGKLQLLTDNKHFVNKNFNILPK